MTLKFRRNIPIVLLLAGILSLLVFTMGNQPIAAYTVDTSAIQSTQIASFTRSFTAGVAGTLNGLIH